VAQIVVHEVGERAHFEVGEEHLAHRPHDAENEEADDRVHQDDRGARQGDDLA
jgi:hypothetical protein